MARFCLTIPGSAWVMLAVLACGLGAACGKGSAPNRDAPARGGVEIPPHAIVSSDIEIGTPGGKIILGIAGDPKTFHPQFCDDVVSQKLNDYIWLRLYEHNRVTREDEPALAESWEYDEAALEWTFHLRKSARWSDGSPLTADDFLFAVQAARDDRYPTTLKEYLKTGDKPFEFSAPDPHTLVVRLPEPDSFAFMNLLELKPMPRHKYERPFRDGSFVEILGTNSKPSEVVSCGPFRLKGYKSGDRVVLERDPNSFYYDSEGHQLPYVDEFVLLVCENFDAMAVRFQNGEMDLIEDILPNNIATLEDGQRAGNYTLFNPGLALTNTHYWFNLKPGGTYENEQGRRVPWTPPSPEATPPPQILSKAYRPYLDPRKLKWFSNRDFRIACSMATHREEMVRTTLFGQGVPIYGFETESNTAWNNPDIPKFPYNPSGATALLESAGFKDRDGDGVREDPEGNPVRFTILTNKENSARERMLTLLCEGLRKVGLDARPQVLDFNDIITRANDTSDYEAILLGLASGVPPHPAQSANIWLSSSRMHTWNPGQATPATEWEAEIDRLYQSLKLTMNEAEQKRIYDRMQVLWAEHQCVIHLVTMKLFVGASNRIGNLKPSVLRPYLSHNARELFVRRGR